MVMVTLSKFRTIFSICQVSAQEFKPLAPAPLTMTRSMSQDQVTGDRRPDTRNRHVDTNIELDLRKLAVFGKDMEDIIAQTLEVGP